MSGGQKAAGTLLGAVGGASLATTMALGSAGAGAKAGAIAGALAGPVGVALGGVVGGAFGYASYWVAQGISSMVNDVPEEATSNADDTKVPQNDGNVENDKDGDGEDEKQVDNGDRDEDREDGDKDEDREDGNKDEDREEESSGSEDEIEEESTESSDYETYLVEILGRIAHLSTNAPLEDRISLFLELCDSLNPVFFDVHNQVRIHRTDRDLVISIPGFRNMVFPTNLRDNLRLFEVDDLEDHLDSVNELEQALIYLLRCRHCGSNYVGLSTQFPNRQTSHSSNVRRGTRTSTNRHLDNHRRETGTQLTFENSFDVIFLKGLPTEINDRMTDKMIKRILRNWEVFLQWLLKGRVGDGGIGKR